MVDKVPMTQGGFVNLQEELRWRQQEERPRIIEAIAEARAHGDLSENAEYHAAKEAQSHNEGRISELEDLIARAEVIDLSKMSGSKIKFGARVKLVDEDTEEEKTYQIVGDQEADVKQGRISISSPIARALIGKEVGDSIEVNAPGGSRRMRFSPFNGADLPFGARARSRAAPPPLIDCRRRKESAQVVDIRDVEVIAPNFKQRLSGVTSTIIQLVPVQRALGQKIAVLGPGLPKSLPSVRFRDLIHLWKRPEGRPCRVWHARRNVEMLPAILLRDLLRMKIRIVFTSASQRRHTGWSKFLIRRMDAVIATSGRTAAYLDVPNTVILHGIDTKRFSHPSTRRRRRRRSASIPRRNSSDASGAYAIRKGPTSSSTA